MTYARLRVVAILSLLFLALPTACKFQSRSQTKQSTRKPSHPQFVLVPEEQMNKPAVLFEKAMKIAAMSSLNVRLEVPFISKYILAGLGIGAAYHYQLGKCGEDCFMRYDIYEFLGDFDGAKIIQGTDSFLFPFGVRRDTQIIFSRNFANASQAAMAKPVNIKSLPLTIEKALSMKTGDSVILPITTRAAIGLGRNFLGSLPQSAPGAFPVLEATGLLQGQLEFHVIRMEGNKVRLRVGAERFAETGTKAGARAKVPAQFLVVSGSLDFSADISGSARQGLRMNMDYELDLSPENTEVHRAYMHAISGRTLLKGAEDLGPQSWDIGTSHFNDLTLLDELARLPDNRVVRLSDDIVLFKGRQWKTLLSAPSFKFGFEREWTKNRLKIVDGADNETAWRLALHRKEISYKLAAEQKNHHMVNGFLVKGDENESDKAPGGLFFIWQKYAIRGKDVEIKKVVNLVKPLLGKGAQKLPIAELLAKPTDAFNAAELWVLFPDELMSLLLDKNVGTQKQLWNALGAFVKNMSLSTDDRMAIGVPYFSTFLNMNLASPKSAEIEESQERSEACAAAQREFGGYLCRYFEEHFLIPLLVAQKEKTVQARLAFLEKQFSTRMLNNEVGSLGLVRYLSEFFSLLGKEASSQIFAKVRYLQVAPRVGKERWLDRDETDMLSTGDSPFEDVLDAVSFALPL